MTDDDLRLAAAERSLKTMLDVDRLDGRTFLDVGCGGGLVSLAARRLGAIVRSFDCDPCSVACARELRQRFFPDDGAWTVEQGSILDADYVASLGTWDVVYAWDVLRHTGDLSRAFEHAGRLVGEDGALFVSIYSAQGRGARSDGIIDMTLKEDAEVALAAARAGAAALAPFLARRIAAEEKADGSPVTEADHAASRAVLAALAARVPADAVISEEAPPPPGWERARRRWFVDPIDGTREFVAGIPQFVVMVGLVVDEQPVVGCILDPTTSEAWLGVVGEGAWAISPSGERTPLRPARRESLEGTREAKSRFQEPPELAAWATSAGVGERTACGSMGLKAVWIVTGRADFHLRPHGKCAYWDSAGPVALLRAAGCEASDGAGGRLRFDEPTLAHHPGLLISVGGLGAKVAASFRRWHESKP